MPKSTNKEKKLIREAKMSSLYLGLWLLGFMFFKYLNGVIAYGVEVIM
jgi:hypothetical protein